MARTQTMVQLTDELVAELDREAARLGSSRSALIRDAVVTYLAQHSEAEKIRRYVEGYRRFPPGEPDEWGDLEAQADREHRVLSRRLEDEERAAGLEW
jgi:hypothetical protein